MKWYKTTPLVQQGSEDAEIWLRKSKNGTFEFPVDIYLGKKTDLLTLKKNIVESIKKQVEYYRNSRRLLYSQSETENVSSCPVCNESSENTITKLSVYGAEYVQCNNCSHLFVIRRPSQKAIHNFYLSDISYAATYTDKKSAESRLNAIAVPWVEWMVKVYKKKYGCEPNKILDVGSGAGHFVEACRRKGFIAHGIELSESSRKFSKEIWGIELDGRNFTDVAGEYAGYNVVTFWGLLEHTPAPKKILQAAYNIVSKSPQGMIISKLPRWNSLSSAIQTLCNDSIIRHLDPMGHIMAFTDASAAELYYSCNVAPIAAWYYGMDIYELLMQIGNKTGNYDHFINTGWLQVELQQNIDEVRFSDGLTIAGTPFYV
ncbi:MAG: methyltransferase domain-containing protein [Bacteroidia bacterium]|nr:methyltransferase domain-containing protein [Bacteroidia bacterium]